MRRAASTAAVLALAIAAALSLPTSGSADLQNQLNSVQAKERALQASKAAAQRQISAYQARVDDLANRLAAVQTSLDLEKSQLFGLRDQLRGARSRLSVLRDKLSRGRRVLVQQLRAQYLEPSPDVVSLIVNSTSFSDLLERADAVRRVQRRNVNTLKDVTSAKRAVTTQARRLARLETRQQQITAAVLIQRNEVGRLEQSAVAKQERARAARDRTASALNSVQARAAAIQKKLEAQIAPAAAGGPAFAAHGGSFGFFQAPGTNYSVGDEPEIARRLDRLGKALHLHLIGISGYRTPQHSVEVGGFSDDPHTKGQASDTPGVEGVPEATLNRFGLTRPFGGAAEADHIQLVGSI
jgi:peptidoglycan hydrolase CwlO-like protein